jgi:hypothetical protein
VDGAATGRVDRAIDRLDRALRAAGFDGLEPAADPASVAEVDAALTPYALPPELRRLWERVDFRDVRVRGWSMPTPCDARIALETHRLNLEAGSFLLFGPPLLFPFARDGEDQWSIELAGRSWAGGRVVAQPCGELRIAYPNVADLLEVYAELIEERRFARNGGHGTLDRDDELERQEARLRAAPPGAHGGDPHPIDREPTTWPAHWLESAGIDLRDREPLGATHTVAGVLAERPARARVAGEVVRLVGSAAGTLVTVDDGSGTIDVWCAAGTSPWGPAHRQRFEFEMGVGDGVAVASAIRPLA